MSGKTVLPLAAVQHQQFLQNNPNANQLQNVLVYVANESIGHHHQQQQQNAACCDHPVRSESTSSCSTVTNDSSNSSFSNSEIPNQQPQFIDVPSAWRRIITNDSQIIYFSPSNVPLNSLGQVHEYLQTQGTCKCGLECPVKVENVFNFDPKVLNKQWSTSFSNLEPTVITDMTKLCNHKRRTINLQSVSSNHLMLPDKHIPSTTTMPSFHHHKGDENELVQCKKRKYNLNLVENSNNVNNTNNINKSITDNNSQFLHQQQTYQNQPQQPPQQQLQSHPQQQQQQKQNHLINKDCPPIMLQHPSQQHAQHSSQPLNSHSHQSYWPGASYSPQQSNTPNELKSMLVNDFKSNYMQQYQSSEVSSTMHMQQQQQSQSQPQNHQLNYNTNYHESHISQNPYNNHQPFSHGSHLSNNNSVTLGCQSRDKQQVVQSHMQHQQSQNNYFIEQYNRNYTSQQNTNEKYSNNNFYQNQYHSNHPNNNNNNNHMQVQQQQQQQQQDLHNQQQSHYAPNNCMRNNHYHYNYQQQSAMPLQAGTQQMQQQQPQQQHHHQNQQAYHYHQQNQYDFTTKSLEQNCYNNCSDKNFGQQSVPNIHQNKPQQPLQPHMAVWNQPVQTHSNCQPNNLTQSQTNYYDQRVSISQQSQIPVPNQHQTMPQLNSQPQPQSHMHQNNQNYWPASNDVQFKKKHKKQMNQKKLKFPDHNSKNIPTYSANNNNNSIPSFIEDPNGYLAQQTALLNNTISKQTGLIVNGNSYSGTTSEQGLLSEPLKINTNNDHSKKFESISTTSSASTESEPKTDEMLSYPSSSSSSSFDNSQAFDNRPIQAGAISTSNGSPDISESASSTASTPVTFNTHTNQIENTNSCTSVVNVNVNSNSTSTLVTSTTTTTTVTISTPNSSQIHVSSSKAFGQNSQQAGDNWKSLSKVSSDNTKVTENEVNITTATTKTPLEMVQSIVSSIQVPPVSTSTKSDLVNNHYNQQHSHHASSIVSHHQPNHRPQQTNTVASSHANFYVSANTGQVIVATSINQTSNTNLINQKSPLLPFGSKIIPTSNPNCSTSTQNLPATVNLMAAPQTLLATTNTPQTLVLNTIPGQFVIQQQPSTSNSNTSLLTVDGTTNHIQSIPQILTGNLIQTQQAIKLDHSLLANQQQQVQSVEKKRSNKKRKSHHHHYHQQQQQQQQQQQPQQQQQQIQQPAQHQTVPIPLLQLQQQNTGILLQQQPSLQVLQQNVECNGQTLTIVPNKNTTTATATPFASQLINAQPAQQINLLQHVNVVNGATGLVHNFPTIQQFIVPTNLSGMLMTTADGTATFVQDTTASLQFQLQNINGQNILTAIPNTATANAAVFPAGMVIRTQNGTQNKLIQQPSPVSTATVGSATTANASATATANQFLSPTNSSTTNGQFMVNGANQLIASNQNQLKNNNTTFVQQNTTIVQQQTTMVSNQQSPQSQVSAVQNQQTVSTQTLNPQPHQIANISPPDTTVASPVHNNTSGNHELKLQQKQSMVHFVSSSAASSTEPEIGVFKNQQIFNTNSSSLVRTTTTTIETTQRNLQDAIISSHNSSVEDEEEYCDDEEDEMDTEMGTIDLQQRNEDNRNINSKTTTDNELTEKNDFKVGELVWGANGDKLVWPGKILKFIDKTNVEIQWFGCNNKTVAIHPIVDLKTLSEGLESHHSIRMKFRRSRKLNSVLEKAIQEAMQELDHQQIKQKSRTTLKPKQKRIRKSLRKYPSVIQN